MNYTITRDQVSAFARDLAGRLRRPRGLVAALVSRLSDELREHFRGRNAEPNKNNWPKQGFWDQIRQATGPGEIGDEAGEVRVADYRFAQKVHGGTITPKNKKMLAIPLHRLAYGLRAGSDASGGFSSFTASTGIKLFRLGNTLAGKLDGETVRFYALKKSVTQRADARALPAREGIAAAFVEEADDYFTIGQGGAPDALT